MDSLPPFLVRNINNLTDARYFAAMLPSYLAAPAQDDFSLLESKISAMQEWIEGPEWALDLLPGMGEEILEKLEKSQIQVSTLIGDEKQISLLRQTPLFKIVSLNAIPSLSETYELADMFVLSANMKLYEGIRSGTTKAIWMEVKNQGDWVKVQPHIGDLGGIVLSGSMEDQVGFKSFDEMEELIGLMLN